MDTDSGIINMYDGKETHSISSDIFNKYDDPQEHFILRLPKVIYFDKCTCFTIFLRCSRINIKQCLIIWYKCRFKLVYSKPTKCYV